MIARDLGVFGSENRRQIVSRTCTSFSRVKFQDYV
jgi:hypothetical protein